MSHYPNRKGFTLIELLIAISISTFLATGMITLVQATSSSFRLQQGLGQLQESARFAAGMIEPAIHQAGFDPEPWNAVQGIAAIAPGSADSFNAVSDRLVINRWSGFNCFENPNSVQDGQGRPVPFLLEISFHATTTGSLVQTCRYGPGAGQLVTQVNNLGLIENVEVFQVEYAEDTDGDGNANQWVRAGQWQAQDRLLGVRFGLLLASPDPLYEPAPATLQVLDHVYSAPADGRLRESLQLAAEIRSRSQ